jgi:hypothetical protein
MQGKPFPILAHNNKIVKTEDANCQ